MNTSINAATSNSAAFFALINHPLKFRLFLLQKLPAAFFSGLRVKEVNEERCIVTVPFKWFTKNPFRSTYFACLSMAAEMSTGILAMAAIYKQPVAISMLVTGIEGKFYKKATGLTRFVCEEGISIKEIVQKAIEDKESHSILVVATGYNQDNERVAEFRITWSFKVKK